MCHPTVVVDCIDEPITCALAATQAVCLSLPTERWADRDVLLPPIPMGCIVTALAVSTDKDVVSVGSKFSESYHQVKGLDLLVDDANWQEACKMDWIPPVSELELTPPIDAMN